jgi:hypothetical protein
VYSLPLRDPFFQALRYSRNPLATKQIRNETTADRGGAPPRKESREKSKSNLVPRLFHARLSFFSVSIRYFFFLVAVVALAVANG